MVRILAIVFMFLFPILVHRAGSSERANALRQVGKPCSAVGNAAVHGFGNETLCEFESLHAKC